MATKPDSGHSPNENSLYTLRQLVITVLAVFAGLAVGAATGLSVGFNVGAGHGVAIGLVVGILAGLGAAVIAGLAVAKGLHALVGGKT